MIDSRRWPSCTRVSPERRPRGRRRRRVRGGRSARPWCGRDRSPSGWQKAPATPHTSGLPVRGGARRRRRSSGRTITRADGSRRGRRVGRRPRRRRRAGAASRRRPRCGRGRSRPSRPRRGASSSRPTIASRVAGDVAVGRRSRAAFSADTRVSLRSNATTGSSKAMYSSVLFIVERSLSGFLGSGDSPRSAVDRTSTTVASGTRPGSSTWSCRPELVAQRDELGVAVAAAHEGERDVVAPELVHDVVRRAHREVDAVLRAHHPEVGDEVPPAAAQLRAGARAAAAGPGRGRCARP